jgi:predicted SnoaL-like aldol condensation-catalyzing enzyme
MSSTEHKRIVHEFLDETYNKGNLKNTNRYVTPDSYIMLVARILKESKLIMNGFPQIVAYFQISKLQS